MSAKLPTEEQNLEQWVDIVMLSPPETNLLFWWLLIIGIGFIASMVLIYFWQHHPVQVAKHQLNKLAKQVRAGDVDNKSLLHRVEKVLCLRYKVAHLSQIKFQNKLWSVFLLQLTDACYQLQNPDPQQTSSLIQQAKSFTRLSGHDK